MNVSALSTDLTLNNDAMKAENEGRWQDAIDLYRRIVDSGTQTERPYVRSASCLVRMGKTAEAEFLLDEASRLFPTGASGFVERARLDLAKGERASAIKRFATVRGKFPDLWLGYAGGIDCLLLEGHYQEAEELIISSFGLVGDKRSSLRAMAHLFDFIAAASRRMSVEQLYAHIENALKEYPNDYRLLEAHAHLARVVHDFPLYLARLTALANQFPDDKGLKQSISQAKELVAADAGYTSRPEIESHVGNAKMFSKFESLGGGGAFGCEFGFMQREAGCEPLGLLRWTTTELVDLIRAIQDRFSGVGDPDSLKMVAGRGPDWGVKEGNYQITSAHTNLQRILVSENQARQRIAKNMTYLATRLVEDMENGDKLFVYRASGEQDSDDKLIALVEALNTYGSNTVLYVCRASHGNPPLKVRHVRPGLMIGYLDWLASDVVPRRFNYSGWATLCQVALDMWERA